MRSSMEATSTRRQPLKRAYSSGFSQAALLKRLRAVCDVNDKYDEPMVRLSDAKLLSWLRRKVTAVQAKLQSDVKLQGTAAQKSAAAHSAQFDTIVGVDVAPTGSAAGGDSTQAALEIAVTLVCEYLEPEVSATLCTAFTVPEALLSAQRGPEKKAGALQPVTNTAPAATSAAASSWAADLAEADAEASAPYKRPAASEPSTAAAKKPKPSAPAKSKLANAPLKKGQTTMMGFFKK